MDDRENKQLTYWKRQLNGAPAVLELPSDRPRPAQQSFQGATRRGTLSRELTAALEASSRRDGVTLFMTLLAALQTLLHLYAGQDDIVVGSPVADRTGPETEALNGFFANTLILRTDLSGNPTFRELLQRVREVTLDAYEHQEMPFERLVEELQAPRDLGHNPLFQVMLVFQNLAASERALGDVLLSEEPVEMVTTRFDLLLDVAKVDEELCYRLTYSTDLFDEATIAQMATDLATLLARFAADPAQPLSAARAWLSRRSLDLAVVATFTAEPLEDSLALWLGELGILGRIRFASFGQVFQELLDPASLLARNREGANVVLVRFEDWIRGDATPQGSGGHADLERSLDDLVLGLKSAAQRCPAPHVVVICPPSPAALARPQTADRFRQLEISLTATLAGANGVHLVTSAEIAALYPVPDIHDAYSESVGHVPYTPLYFAALGTAVVRRLVAILGAPYKVIVLDCDNTLWKGIVGEAGPVGVELDAPRRLLQELVLEQHERGMLICLCSKNNEADVLEVFERRPEMPLRMEHILAHRINWRPKSENLVSLAEELHLGLDSFVFVDDSPLECAEVKARCPDVLTVELPADPAAIPHALRHVWAFDHLTTSKEDQQRTALYRQNAQRERLRNEVPTLVGFVAGLGLEVTTAAMTSAHVERVAQLTQRTNQFNCTTVRRVESELLQRLAAGELEGLVTEVRDRFGDYGLVGCVLFATAPDALLVDTFLLSCRALGRGVEVRMLVRLGEIARERGLSRIEIGYRRTKKNKPALELLERVGRAFQKPAAEGYTFELPAAYLQALDAAAYLGESELEDATTSPRPATPAQAEQSRRAFVVPDRVPTTLDRAEKVLEKAEARRRRRVITKPDDELGPRGALEVKLLAIWEELLGAKGIGVNDSFFDVGGQSLLAMRLFDKIERSFGVTLPVALLFQAPTVAKLAAILRREGWMPSWSSLVSIQTAGRRPPFFCVHAVGGNVLNYRALSRHLGDDVPFYGLQSRGLGGDEAPHATIEEMAAAYLGEIRQQWPHGPYQIGGASFGGMVAYEMAQQLHAAGERVGALILLDTYRPGPPPARLIEARTASPVHPRGLLLDRHFGNLLLRKPREGYAYLVGRAQERLDRMVATVAGAPHLAPPPLRKVIESNLRAVNAYVPRPYLGRAVMLLSRDEPGRVFYDGRLAWADLLGDGLTLHFTPGDHTNMLDEPRVADVAAALDRCLD
jgi:FkbH-like protein